MRIDWNVVGICAAVVFCGMLLLKPLGCGFERLKSLPRELLVLFLSFAIIAAVEAAGYGASRKGAGKAASPAAEEDALRDRETPVLKRRLLSSRSEEHTSELQSR